MTPLQIKPNVPLVVAIVNPEGVFDFEGGFGLYETTAGQTFILPRPAVVLLNTLDPEPGEEIVITKHWSGKRGEKAEWTVALSPNSEKCRAKAEETPATLSQQLEASIEHERERRRSLGDPTPIRRPSKRAPAPEVQPRLFDRGTGTHGPAPAIQPEDVPRSIPLPAVAIGRQQRPGQIPANVATREILAFVNADPNTANWSADARQGPRQYHPDCQLQGWIHRTVGKGKRMKTTDEKPLTKFERVFCLVVAILYSAVIYWRFFFTTFHREDF